MARDKYPDEVFAVLEGLQQANLQSVPADFSNVGIALNVLMSVLERKDLDHDSHNVVSALSTLANKGKVVVYFCKERGKDEVRRVVINSKHAPTQAEAMKFGGSSCTISIEGMPQRDLEQQEILKQKGEEWIRNQQGPVCLQNVKEWLLAHDYPQRDRYSDPTAYSGALSVTAHWMLKRIADELHVLLTDGCLRPFEELEPDEQEYAAAVLDVVQEEVPQHIFPLDLSEVVEGVINSGGFTMMLDAGAASFSFDYESQPTSGKVIISLTFRSGATMQIITNLPTTAKPR